jgi:hypothetical protein
VSVLNILVGEKMLGPMPVDAGAGASIDFSPCCLLYPSCSEEKGGMGRLSDSRSLSAFPGVDVSAECRNALSLGRGRNPLGDVATCL